MWRGAETVHIDVPYAWANSVIDVCGERLSGRCMIVYVGVRQWEGRSECMRWLMSVNMRRERVLFNRAVQPNWRPCLPKLKPEEGWLGSLQHRACVFATAAMCSEITRGPYLLRGSRQAFRENCSNRRAIAVKWTERSLIAARKQPGYWQWDVESGVALQALEATWKSECTSFGHDCLIDTVLFPPSPKTASTVKFVRFGDAAMSLSRSFAVFSSITKPCWDEWKGHLLIGCNEARKFSLRALKIAHFNFWLSNFIYFLIGIQLVYRAPSSNPDLVRIWSYFFLSS